MSETALTVAGTSDVLGPVPMDALMAAASRFEAAVKMGEVYAASGLFKDVKTAAQAVVKIMAGFEIGDGWHTHHYYPRWHLCHGRGQPDGDDGACLRDI